MTGETAARYERTPATEAIVAVSVAVLVVAAPATASHDQTKLTASDAGDGDRFGASVALDGDTALIGADEKDSGRGAAYVFTRSGGTWTQQQKLTADDADDFDRFGTSVALDGDTALVSADLEDGAGDDRGAAYVFTRSGGTWTQQQKLTADDAQDGDEFGGSVALDGDTALIGARREDGGGEDRGAAYAFTRTGGTWTQQQKLTANDAQDVDRFGASVALDGDTALIGARRDNSGGPDSGAAYVFTRSGGTWTQQQELTADDAQDFDHFGGSVALDGDTALIGAADEDGGGEYSGAAYAFTQSGGTWTQQQKLTANDAEDRDQFGGSVALDGDVALVGAAGKNASGKSYSGAAYTFARSSGTWAEQQKLIADDAQDFGHFGASVLLDGDVALIGAWGESNSGVRRGAAYAIDLDHDPTADFSHAPSDPVGGQDVDFTDRSSDDGTVTGWAWDFGDGSTASSQHPTHAFPDDGTYTVCLTVTDDIDQTDETCTAITVGNAKPRPDYTYGPQDVATGDPVAFSDATTDDGSVTSWTWDFGDGSPTKSTRNPSHVYDDDGSYRVCLSVTDDDGASASTCKDVRIASRPPTAEPTVTTASPAAGRSVSFSADASDSDGSVRSIGWDFGDGATGSGPNPSHTYEEPGTYEVTVTVIDDAGRTTTESFQVTVEPGFPWALVAGLVALAAVGGGAYRYRDEIGGLVGGQTGPGEEE